MAWNPGDRVIVRGAEWRVVHATLFSDCEAIDLASEHTRATRTLLLPFDRPRSPSPPRLQVVSRRRWVRDVSSRIRAMHPYGGLRSCPLAIRLLPYQLEPALAVLRHGIRRVLIADDVGLGKTVQAALIVREIAVRHHGARALIVTPAAVRDQWKQELATLFELDAIEADAAWLRRCSRELPADVNPWSVPGVYLASMDFAKRAEALRPLEDVRWDLLIVDEAHAATPGSDRRAAVDALAARSRILVLLTATPHSGDDEQFAALCALGAGPGSPAVRLFRRSRTDAPLDHGRSRSCLIAVRQSAAEQRTHRLLDDYTVAVWAECARRSDTKGKLVATVLRKRALSSLASLARSVRRRLELLGSPLPEPFQLTLPLQEDDHIHEDEAPDLLLGVPSLTDRPRERHALNAVIDAAELASTDDSKLRALQRLLRRVREPAIVFTEYRDTADHLSRALGAAGHRIALLHGGLTHRERAAVVASFRSGDSVLIATDAASEGLNLHHACRLVVHFELPWVPARLRQRRGRLDRIGQTRRVHEIALVANDTCEQLVLAPLVRRARQSGGFASSPLVDRVSESRMAAHVLGGAPIDDCDGSVGTAATVSGEPDLGTEARDEVARLSQLRRLSPSPQPERSRASQRAVVPIVTSTRGRLRLGGDLTLVLEVSLRDQRGLCGDHHALVVSGDFGGVVWSGRPATLRREVERAMAPLQARIAPIARHFIESRIAAVAPVWARASDAIRRRDVQMHQHLRSAAREMVQAGLFDRRAMRAAAARDRGRSMTLDDLESRIAAADEAGNQLQGSFAVVAICVR